MAKLRIAYDNAITRTNSLSASNVSVPIANVLTPYKTSIFRSQFSTDTLTATWAAGETLSCVAFPFSNLSKTATVKVQLFDSQSGGTKLLDTGFVQAAAGSQIGDSLYSNVPSGVNSFSYGGGVYGVVWFTRTAGVQRLQIDISDTGQPIGYIEFAFLVAGDYWESPDSCDWGDMSLSLGDTSKQSRSESGDLRVDRGVVYKTLSLSLQWMTDTDKDRLWRIMRGSGMYSNVFVSVLPESTDARLEQMHMIYGKLSKQSVVGYKFFNQFTSTIDIEEC